MLALILMLPLELRCPQSPKMPSMAEFNCLVTNIFYEARGESFKGKVAVGLVTLNRLKYMEYPDTICGVVFQKKQFSWTSVKQNRVKINEQVWLDCIDAAYKAILFRGSFTATHYHNTSVRPKWGFKKLGQIGNHIFYRQ